MNKTLLIILGVVVLAYLVGGCGGNKPKNNANINFYEEEESDYPISGGSVSSVKSVSTQAVSEEIVGISSYGTWICDTPTMKNAYPLVAIYEIDGEPQNVIVDIAESINDGSYTITNPMPDPGYSRVYIRTNKFGKGSVVANYQAASKEINILVYNAIGNISMNYFLINNNDDFTYINNANSILHGNEILVPCYEAGTCDSIYWDQGFNSIKNIDTNESRFSTGHNLVYNSAVGAQNPVYICKTYNGYVKITKLKNVTVWEWVAKAGNPAEQVPFM